MLGALAAADNQQPEDFYAPNEGLPHMSDSEKPSLKPISRALISVSDKAGIVDFAQGLVAQKIEIISTGGTAKMLTQAGIDCRDGSELTGFPEMMDGRVKTLHPIVHGGLLAIRDNETHADAMRNHGIGAIDLLVVNLYPFEETVRGGGAYEACIENIDIGGPAMIRAAAKNHQDVTVVVDPQDYAGVLDSLQAHEGTQLALRQKLAQKAYARTAAYDAEISNWMAAELDVETPAFRAIGGHLQQGLRYGENPHQQAGFYVGGPLREASQRRSRYRARSFPTTISMIPMQLLSLCLNLTRRQRGLCHHQTRQSVWRGMRCRFARSVRQSLGVRSGFSFGGIIAMNRPLDATTAEAITQLFTEVIIAPGADDAARNIIAAKKNLRLLITTGLADRHAEGLSLRTVAGGFLAQNRDAGAVTPEHLKTVTKRGPEVSEMADLLFAWQVAKHVKSNAIVYAKDGATVGIGAGQMSRLDSSRIAARKSEDAAEAAGLSTPLVSGSVVASDAFFPFADGLLSAANAGATAIIQPGGSIRDDEVIAAADEAGLAMVFTGIRHFRH